VAFEVVRLQPPLTDKARAALSRFDCAILRTADGDLDSGEVSVSQFLASGEAEAAALDGASTVYIAADFDESDEVLGYISLAFSQVTLTNGEKKRGAINGNRGMFGALRIAMIGTHRDYRGNGIGSALLEHALGRAALASRHVATVRFIVVDAADTALSWYEAHNFVPNNSQKEQDRLKDSPRATSMRLDLGIDVP
jgi:ribosomal protein S18 acetylase RimI-like enzyme